MDTIFQSRMFVSFVNTVATCYSVVNTVVVVKTNLFIGYSCYLERELTSNHLQKGEPLDSKSF